MFQNLKNFICRKGRKIGNLKYTDRTELKKITIIIYSNYLIYSSLFSHTLNFIAVRFVLFLKTLQITVQVSCLFYVLLLSRFFKGKLKSIFLSGLSKK